jgi:hypothetical protein
MPPWPSENYFDYEKTVLTHWKDFGPGKDESRTGKGRFIAAAEASSAEAEETPGKG